MGEIRPTEVEGCFVCVFLTCPLKTTPRRSLRAAVRWHQNKATQSVIKLLSAIFDNTTPVIKFYFVSVPDILYGRLRDFYMILNCLRAQKLNYAAMHNGHVPIERWLLTWSYRPGYCMVEWDSSLFSTYTTHPPLYEQFSSSFRFVQFSHWTVKIWKMSR